MSIYKKPVRLLMKEMVNNLGIKKGEQITTNQIVEWFNQNYPKIKLGTIKGHLVKMTVNSKSRHHHNFKPIEDDLFYQINKNTYKLFDIQINIQNNSHLLTKQDKIIEKLEKTRLETNKEKNQFTYEKDLQNFLSKNLTLIEPELKLFKDNNINGIEYPVGNRYIDILALDKNNNYVIIELKVSRSYDRVIGQLLRYIAWIKKYKAKNNQNVRGIIIAKKISNDLLLACEELPNIELFEYELSVTLNKKQ